jgi:hypothetical protein
MNSLSAKFRIGERGEGHLRHWRLALGALIVSLVGAGCDQDQVLQKFTTPEDQATATEQLDLLRNHRFVELEARMDPSIKSPNLRATLEAMARGLPPGAPAEKKLVGAYTNFNNGQRSANLTYQYRFGDQYVLANCAFARRGDQVVILGMEVRPLATSLESASRVDFKGKSPRHYAIAGAAVLAVLLSLAAFIACVLEKDLKRKWAWILFIIFGVTQTSLNWTTGEISFSPLSFQLFSGGWVAGVYSAWTLTVAAPVGAVAYLTRRLLNSRRPKVS